LLLGLDTRWADGPPSASDCYDEHHAGKQVQNAARPDKRHTPETDKNHIDRVCADFRSDRCRVYYEPGAVTFPLMAQE
jgi:hypothetical protein